MSSEKFLKLNILFFKKAQTNFSTFSKSLLLKLNKNSKFYEYNSRFDKMISIRYNEKTEKINLALKVLVHNNNEREFTLNRNLDEELGNTLQRLYASYTKQLNVALNKANKKLKKNEPEENENATSKRSEEISKDSNDENNLLPLTLYDIDNNTVSLTTKNRDAWKENYTFKFNEQTFKVTVNLPALKKVSLSKTLIAGMSALVKIEAEPESNFEELNSNSFFSWFVSVEKFQSSASDKFKLPHQGELDKMKWNLLEEGLNKKSIVLGDECENRLIKGKCQRKKKLILYNS
jgi:hypothetical protein